MTGSVVLTFLTLFAHARSHACFDCRGDPLIKPMGTKLGLSRVYYTELWVSLNLKSTSYIFDGNRIIIGGTRSQR